VVRAVTCTQPYKFELQGDQQGVEEEQGVEGDGLGAAGVAGATEVQLDTTLGTQLLQGLGSYVQQLGGQGVEPQHHQQGPDGNPLKVQGSYAEHGGPTAELQQKAVMHMQVAGTKRSRADTSSQFPAQELQALLGGAEAQAVEPSQELQDQPHKVARRK
jgi:hypothetical protein